MVVGSTSASCLRLRLLSKVPTLTLASSSFTVAVGCYLKISSFNVSLITDTKLLQLLSLDTALVLMFLYNMTDS